MPSHEAELILLVLPGISHTQAMHPWMLNCAVVVLEIGPNKSSDSSAAAQVLALHGAHACVDAGMPDYPIVPHGS